MNIEEPITFEDAAFTGFVVVIMSPLVVIAIPFAAIGWIAIKVYEWLYPGKKELAS